MYTATTSPRSEEHTSELQSRELISYAVFCLKKKKAAHRRPIHLDQRHVLDVEPASGADPLHVLFFFQSSADHRDLHKLTHSFPTRRSSDLARLTARPGGQSLKSQPGSISLPGRRSMRSEEHTSELQSRELISYAVFCLK